MSIVINDWNIAEIKQLLRECGKLSMQHYVDPSIKLKADHSVVTPADTGIENLLARRFDHPEAGVYLIGEETLDSRSEDYIQRALKGVCWIIDPIDGTAPFVTGIPAWGISVALAKDGRIIEGAIYLPPQDELFYTSGANAYRVRNFSSGGKCELMAKCSSHRNLVGAVSISQQHAKYGRVSIPGPVFSLGGCVASFYFMFTGKIMAYVAAVSLWDIAASLAIMERLGFSAVTGDGNELTSLISEKLYELSPGSQNRWKLRGYAVIATSRNIANEIFSKITLPDNL